ncbi:MAG: DUF2752 domain-containing protein [Myxococcota bacterium]
MPDAINIEVEDREPGKVPIGALLMLPLFLMPLGGYLVQENSADMGICSLKALVGLPCMTCGSTRATMRLLYGDVAHAILFQPMMIAIYVGLGLWGGVSFVSFLMDKRVKVELSDTWSIAFKVSLAAIPLLNWAYLIAIGV